MIKRVSQTQRQELRKRKESRDKLEKLIIALVKKGIIKPEEIK